MLEIINMHINKIDFIENCNKFDELEKRGSFYEMAINLIKNDFEIEAFFLILATWNFASFRYAVKDFDINSFRELVENKCNPIFNKLADKKFETVNFDEIADDVRRVYTLLSGIKGIKYTGAPKIMHFKNPNLFVMWDGYIKKHYGFKQGTSEEYLEFLKKMQNIFVNIEWSDKHRTFVKAIDEYNYVTITLPALKKVKNQKRII